ncbi:MAG: TIM barrel protein [Bryobacteraceae bacterium]|jgi:sugar phosphate isomerase/epimerase
MTRRTLLLAALTCGAGPCPAADRPIRLGGPIFLKSDDPAELAKEHRRLGYTAAYCPPGKPAEIKKAFAKEDVVIAEVGAWRNLLDPDPAKRRDNLSYVSQRLQLAEEVGARCCVDVAGSFNPDLWYGPNPKNLSQEFFDATVENVRKLIDEVKPKQTKFSIEMMPWSLPDGPDSYVKLIGAVNRPSFGVHLDVCNVINTPDRFYRNSEIITECFEKLRPWILSCHAKDLAWETKDEYNVHFQETIPGRGQINYATYLKELTTVDAPLMLEHLKSPEDYAEARAYIHRIADESGVKIL